MTSDRRFFSGDSLVQALNQAAQHFQLLPDQIRYKVVEKRHGFLRARKKIMIEVSQSNPTGERAGDQVAELEAAEIEIAQTTIDTEELAADERRWIVEPRAPERRDEPDVEPAQSVFEGSMLEPDDDDAEPEPAPRGRRRGRRRGRGRGSSAEETRQASPPARTRGSVVEAEGTGVEDTPEEVSEDAAEGEPRGRRRGRRRGRGGSSHVALREAPQSASTRFPVAEGEEAKAAARALEMILGLASLELESKILQGDEQLEIELWGEDQEILLRDRGRLLLAIQHLLPRVTRGLIGSAVVCRVDSDSFHEIREERLRDMAQRAADEVRQQGRPSTLEPMSPDERRIVHMTLADYPGIETESQGSGLFKRVMVRPVGKDGPRGFDPYKR